MYVGNNPIINTDPMGLMSVLPYEPTPCSDWVYDSCSKSRVCVPDAHGNDAILKFVECYLNSFCDDSIAPGDRRIKALACALRHFDKCQHLAVKLAIWSWLRGSEWPEDYKYYVPHYPFSW